MKTSVVVLSMALIAMIGCRPEKIESPVSDANKNIGSIRSRGYADVGNVNPGSGETALISQETAEILSNYEYDSYTEEAVNENDVLITVYFSSQEEMNRFICNECTNTFSTQLVGNGVKMICDGPKLDCRYVQCENGVEIIRCMPAV